jgi:hypothetical protein
VRTDEEHEHRWKRGRCRDCGDWCLHPASQLREEPRPDGDVRYRCGVCGIIDREASGYTAPRPGSPPAVRESGSVPDLSRTQRPRGGDVRSLVGGRRRCRGIVENGSFNRPDTGRFNKKFRSPMWWSTRIPRR